MGSKLKSGWIMEREASKNGTVALNDHHKTTQIRALRAATVCRGIVDPDERLRRSLKQCGGPRMDSVCSLSHGSATLQRDATTKDPARRHRYNFHFWRGDFHASTEEQQPKTRHPPPMCCFPASHAHVSRMCLELFDLGRGPVIHDLPSPWGTGENSGTGSHGVWQMS